MDRLIEKYNVAVPRYTSYPTVPHWSSVNPSADKWIELLQKNYAINSSLSLYIHLPFCEALCTYCGCNKRITKNHQVEQPYISAVLKEWKMYLNALGERPKVKEIHLGGGTPTFFSPENLKTLLSTILDSVEIEKDYEFSFEAHPFSTSKEHLQELHDLGFRRISIGVQDVSQEILKAINRHQSKEQVQDVVNWARAIGYDSVNFDIIYGLPFQQKHHITDTINFVRELMPDRIAFYSYAHVPWKSASQRAFTINDVPKGNEKNQLFELGKNMLEESKYKAIGMDHFCKEDEALFVSYQNKKMHRNFMGYTPHYSRCSIALGASSISDCWDMFVQNEKSIEKYQELVNNGELPLVKGHVLTEVEATVRQHILELMCTDSTEWEKSSLSDEIFSSRLSKLDEMVNEELVEYTDTSIKVLPKGKYFIRNICSMIDPYMEVERNQPTFSKAI